MSTKEIKEIFQAYPKAKVLYQDSNGFVWLQKETAEGQSKGKEVKTLKRNEFITKTKTI